MNLKVVWTSRFKKDYKLAVKRRLNIKLLDDTIRMLASGKTLPEEYNDHQLTGNLKNYRECHIQPDSAIIFYITGFLSFSSSFDFLRMHCVFAWDTVHHARRY